MLSVEINGHEQDLGQLICIFQAKMKRQNRRNFLKEATLVAGLPVISPLLLNQSMLQPKMTSVPKDAVILFQGDSITDARRDKGAYYANNLSGLGDGYAFLAAAKLLADHPEKSFHIYNRGISGNKVYQLANRWKDDCLNLQPDVLSILIGVNDFWHALKHGYDGTIDTYRTDLTALLKRTKEALPSVQLIIGEPFAVAGGSAIDENWNEDFDAYRYAAKEIASEFKSIFIPYHDIFTDALKVAPVEYWCPDGVHPSLAGAQLMAQHWLAAFNKL